MPRPAVIGCGERICAACGPRSVLPCRRRMSGCERIGDPSPGELPGKAAHGVCSVNSARSATFRIFATFAGNGRRRRYSVEEIAEKMAGEILRRSTPDGFSRDGGVMRYTRRQPRSRFTVMTSGCRERCRRALSYGPAQHNCRQTGVMQSAPGLLQLPLRAPRTRPASKPEPRRGYAHAAIHEMQSAAENRPN